MASFVEDEITTQPDCWVRAAALAPQTAQLLPQAGERVAQRVDVARALRLGVNADRPRHLTRSVVLAG